MMLRSASTHALSLSLASALAASAQTIQAPNADRMVRELLAAHPEMQTIGVHATAPGQTQNTNIACSKPGKVGKVSAPIDMGVIATGKSYLRHTPKGAIDMGLPLADAHGTPIGMVVIVLRESFTHDDATASARAVAIRDELQSKIASVDVLYTGATIAKTPLYLVAQTPLPELQGAFAHLAIDPAADRVYAAAPDNHSIEIFTRDGDLVRSAKGIVKTPHTLAVDPEARRVLVTDAGDSAVVILTAGDLQPVARIPLPSPPGAGLYDPHSRRLFVALSGKAAGSSASHIAVVDQARVVQSFELQGTEVEGMALDPDRGMLFVNLADRATVATIDLTGGTVSYWSVPGLNRNTPMAWDQPDGLLLVAGRSPGKLLLLDPFTRQVVQSMDTVDGADDLTFDPARMTVYLSGDEGLAVYELDNQHRLQPVTRFPTMKARNSAFDPATQQLYLVHGTNDLDGAALELYRTFR